MTDNLRIWDALAKTDPAHTKGFQRAGGFKGTAIKPIWSAKRMTEYFGPCGTGWGMDEPTFQVVTANDEILVFCTVGLWYREPDSEKPGHVFGVGGDKVLIKQQSGLRTNDEAFKASFTDAISNAMKQIGVGADVHMGLFDDEKYVREMKAEFADDHAPPPRQEPSPRPATGAQKPFPGDTPSDAVKGLAESLKRSFRAAKNADEYNVVNIDPDMDRLMKEDRVLYNEVLAVADVELARIDPDAVPNNVLLGG